MVKLDKKSIRILLPVKYFEKMDLLINRGDYVSYSEIIREAVKNFLRERGIDVQDEDALTLIYKCSCGFEASVRVVEWYGRVVLDSNCRFRCASNGGNVLAYVPVCPKCGRDMEFDRFEREEALKGNLSNSPPR